MEGLGGDLVWVEDENFNQLSHDKLAAMLDDLSGPVKDNIDIESCLPAYQVFLKFARDMVKNNRAEMEENWNNFWLKYSDNEVFEKFIELFEHIQIKSYSETL